MKEPPSFINWFNKDRSGQDIGDYVRNLGQRCSSLHWMMVGVMERHGHVYETLGSSVQGLWR